MAELLVNVQTGEVVHVAEDGHKWGRRESREVYDAEVARLGRAPQAVTREVVHEDVPIADGRGGVVRDDKGAIRTIREARPVPGSERMRDIPPPDRLGIIRVPGPAADWAYLMDDVLVEEDGELRSQGRAHTLDMTGALAASDVLARTVTVTRAALAARERRSEAARGN